ncbi:MAG: Alkaline phosphatase [Bacteroidetes bacterium]|nr:Alkaline phosphatase [Bacteroidota bacterium]
MNRFITLFLCLTITLAAHAQSYLLPSRPLVDSSLAPFFHGVASGDPLSDRVILWTRVTTEDVSVSVDWQIATDTLFANVVSSGTITTDTSIDHTVKVDATGLTANMWYYYRFKAYNRYSAIGRTRTVPVGNNDSLRFAIVACSNFQAGFFNVYHDIATRNDLDAVLHLGDYYYEYEATGYGYDGDSNRLHSPDHEALTLADYRMRHSQYKLDPDLRYCHQQYPFITIWDDHETANDSYHDGAQNHTPSTEGDWFTRKDAGKKAYFEWLPIREISAGNDTIIHRTEHWGDLLDLIMIDTRYEGRDSSLGQFISATNPYLTDTARHLLGNEQLTWFKGELSNSTSKWRVIGNQVMIAPLQAAGQVLNGDQWDGYPAERRRVLDHIMQNNLKNIVFLTGDIHCSWGNDIPHPDSTYVQATGRGSVATEMVCTSVTSPTFAGLGSVPLSAIQLFDKHVKYAELSLRGYLLLDVNKVRVQGDWVHMSTVTSKIYTATDDAHWMNNDNERFLRQAPSALGPRPGNPPLTQFVTSIGEVANNMVIIGCYPNPAENEVAIQYYLSEPSKVEVTITDISGKNVYTRSTQQTQYGLFNTKAYIDNLAAGSYIVSISASGKTYSKQIVKNK